MQKIISFSCNCKAHLHYSSIQAEWTLSTKEDNSIHAVNIRGALVYYAFLANINTEFHLPDFGCRYSKVFSPY
jgi:hypothetical protein